MQLLTSRKPLKKSAVTAKKNRVTSYVAKKVKAKMSKKRKRSSQLPAKGGMVVGYNPIKKNKEKLFFLGDDVHSLVLGATRSGKTRSMLLQSICFTGLAGESMIISDPKGEIFDYTAPFLRSLKYNVIALDFKTPTKSQKYNFLQPVITALKLNDMPKAVELVWDITSSIVPRTKGERIWEDGEASVIAGAIMAVVHDNQKKPALQNLTNVYHFISEMCKPGGEGGGMPLDRYLDALDDRHPAKSLFATVLVAPSRTRGSFLTAALTNLRLFTSPYIYNMSCESSFELSEVGNVKHAIFIILPDGKETYNRLASLFVYQQYQAILDNADSKGGRLDVRTNFMLEEFGNFTKIPGFTQMLTVGGGRGIRFNLVIQSFSQLDDIYGKEQADTIRDNCHCLIYLHSENPNTNGDISKRLGKYTTSSYGRSNNTTSRRSINSSASLNIIGRDLLTPDEVKKIERPFVLVMYSGNDPAIMVMPDISKWFFNDMLGMGDREFNKKLRLFRSNERSVMEIKPIELWRGAKQSHVQKAVADDPEVDEFFGHGPMADPADMPIGSAEEADGDEGFEESADTDYGDDASDDDAAKDDACEVAMEAKKFKKSLWRKVKKW